MPPKTVTIILPYHIIVALQSLIQRTTNYKQKLRKPNREVEDIRINTLITAQKMRLQQLKGLNKGTSAYTRIYLKI
jgi:hypothetical protein